MPDKTEYHYDDKGHVVSGAAPSKPAQPAAPAVDKDQTVTRMTGARPDAERIKQLAVGIREEARAAFGDSQRLAGLIKTPAEAELIRGIVARLATVNRHVDLITDL